MLKIKTPCIPPGEPHKSLSDYGFFEGDISDLQPIEGIIPYDLNTPLFSDYAGKLRFVYVPDGSTVVYNEEDVLDFPLGSVLIKNFFYQADATDPLSGRMLLETRLLMNKKEGWTAETYVWNEEQTSAERKRTGDMRQVVWTDTEGVQRNINYLIPTKNDCKTCHSTDFTLSPLGPKVRNLNKSYDYSVGEENQLTHWMHDGILTGVPSQADIPRVPIWNHSSTGTLNERARIYLDVNCGSCHNPGGSASNSSLFLNLEEDNEFNLGIFKRPVASGSGSGGLKYDIHPGKPDSSIMVYRMESVEPDVRMPELGRTVVHEEAVALIREWIANLE